MTRMRSAAPNRIDTVRHAPSWLDRLAALTLVLAGIAGAIIVVSWVVGTRGRVAFEGGRYVVTD
jgi:hypothetical protein